MKETLTKSSAKLNGKTRLNYLPQWLNRLMYVAFTLAGLLLLVKGDLGEALVPLGLALIFDPFDPEVSLNDRLWYQKGILFIHLIVLYVAIALLIFN